MTGTKDLDSTILEAIGKIQKFILQATGEPPISEELSSALTRYFVLKEITDFVEMSRLEGENRSSSSARNPVSIRE